MHTTAIWLLLLTGIDCKRITIGIGVILYENVMSGHHFSLCHEVCCKIRKHVFSCSTANAYYLSRGFYYYCKGETTDKVEFNECNDSKIA